MNAMALRSVAAALSVSLLAAGCALLSPTEPATEKHVLAKMPDEVPRQKARHARLLVLRPDADPIYDTVQMAYTAQPYDIGYFRQHEWGERPSLMLHALLTRTMAETGCFDAVLTPPYAGRYTFALESKLIELAQDFTSEPPTLRLAMHLELSDASHRLIAMKDVSVREPMLQKTPYAGVVAANDATAGILRQVAEFVLERAR